MKILLTFILLLSILKSDLRLQDHDFPDEITTFIMVRHAEKADDSRNADLSAEGYERARLLYEMLEFVHIDVIYSTMLIRTMETVKPIADSRNLALIEYDHRTPEAVASEWLKRYSGKTVLVSGHSNSTPMFVNAILGREHFAEKFDETDYGNLIIITISSDGKSSLVHLRY